MSIGGELQEIENCSIVIFGEIQRIELIIFRLFILACKKFYSDGQRILPDPKALIFETLK